MKHASEVPQANEARQESCRARPVQSVLSEFCRRLELTVCTVGTLPAIPRAPSPYAQCTGSIQRPPSPPIRLTTSPRLSSSLHLSWTYSDMLTRATNSLVNLRPRLFCCHVHSFVWTWFSKWTNWGLQRRPIKKRRLGWNQISSGEFPPSHTASGTRVFKSASRITESRVEHPQAPPPSNSNKAGNSEPAASHWGWSPARLRALRWARLNPVSISQPRALAQASSPPERSRSTPPITSIDTWGLAVSSLGCTSSGPTGWGPAPGVLPWASSSNLAPGWGQFPWSSSLKGLLSLASSRPSSGTYLLWGTLPGGKSSWTPWTHQALHQDRAVTHRDLTNSKELMSDKHSCVFS